MPGIGDRRERRHRTPVEAMCRIWMQDQAEFHGQHVEFGPIESWPKPLQRAHPPILVGGEGRGVLQRVIAYGDEWMPEGRTSVDALAVRIDELQELAALAGREPILVTVYAPPPTTYDPEWYPKGVQISDTELAAVPSPPTTSTANGTTPSTLTQTCREP